MFTRIDHIGIAVENIDDALALYERDFNLGEVYRQTVLEQGVDAALFDVGENHVELIAPAVAGEGTVARFLAKHGPGMHHVAYQVDDIDAELARIKELGLKLIDREPREGIRNSRVAFLNPRSTGGVLTELVEPAKGH